MPDNYVLGERTDSRTRGPVKSARDEGGDVLSDRVTPRVAGGDVSATNPLPVSPTVSEVLLAVLAELRELRRVVCLATQQFYTDPPDFKGAP